MGQQYKNEQFGDLDGFTFGDNVVLDGCAVGPGATVTDGKVVRGQEVTTKDDRKKK
ncbi:hypothetical protein Q8791_30480 [Nocardiopsis sp. CT-R113]|uniref:Uncharacterized protein n=1 Tax=Nocardiopsis codii TaxID=3065942 RepID=A0ABU7KHT2_9ACTN|nr:hypothetical protein [Nocardiopsis sp. CT-R113]MEE2041557.1 hypothetical protein [Nocardiopsis sp. CT-R113]